jgi:hypothetical protein
MPEPGTPVIWLRYLTSRTDVLGLISLADGVGVTTISGGVDSVAVTWCVSLRFVSRSVLKVVARCISQLGGNCESGGANDAELDYGESGEDVHGVCGGG